MKLKINGITRQFQGDPEMPLLWYLRDVLRLTGTKFGCGIGLCGSCTVHVDGAATRIEGLSADGENPVQRAWMEANVPECGYCQSGQIMQAVALLKETPRPTDSDIDQAMEGMICRCGTYQRIRRAIKIAAGVKA
jgi:isoquinoline 1-oxidoreductase alpha subunit